MARTVAAALAASDAQAVVLGARAYSRGAGGADRRVAAVNRSCTGLGRP
jgi:hypothetical protein